MAEDSHHYDYIEPRRVCSWCEADMGPAPKGCEHDTHGICRPCFLDMMEPLDAMPTAPTCPHGCADSEWCQACECEV